MVAELGSVGSRGQAIGSPVHGVDNLRTHFELQLYLADLCICSVSSVDNSRYKLRKWGLSRRFPIPFMRAWLVNV